MVVSSSWQWFMPRSDYIRVCCLNHTTLLRYSMTEIQKQTKTNGDQPQQTHRGSTDWSDKTRQTLWSASVGAAWTRLKTHCSHSVYNRCETVWKWHWMVELSVTRLMDKDDAIRVEMKAAAFHSFIYRLISHSLIRFVSRPHDWNFWNVDGRKMSFS